MSVREKPCDPKRQRRRNRSCAVVLCVVTESNTRGHSSHQITSGAAASDDELQEIDMSPFFCSYEVNMR